MTQERIPISEVAKIIGVSEPQVRNLMKRGALPIGQVLSPKMTERVPMNKAAKILGIGAPQVRNFMKRGVMPIGQVLSPNQTGKSTYTFYVYRNKLEKYIGRNLTEEEISKTP